MTPTSRIYIVTSGEYSDYTIRAVFANYADAEKFVNEINSELPISRVQGDAARVETWAVL